MVVIQDIKVLTSELQCTEIETAGFLIGNLDIRYGVRYASIFRMVSNIRGVCAIEIHGQTQRVISRL